MKASNARRGGARGIGTRRVAKGKVKRLKDRRKYVRMKKKIPLRVHKRKLIIIKSPEMAGEVMDISKTGVKLVTTLDLAKGDTVVLAISTEHVASLQDFHGKVAWIEKIKKGDRTFTKAGIEFRNLDSGQSNLLDRLAYGGR